jgi:hypothetical protein
MEHTSGSSTRNRRLTFLLAIAATTSVHLNLSCQAFAPAYSRAKLFGPSTLPRAGARNGPNDDSYAGQVVTFSSGGSTGEERLDNVLTGGVGDDGPKTTTTLSLEDKMKSWEATEEEIKAATLGGLVPQLRDNSKERNDAFDVGLYIAFPFMVVSGLMFALFPLIVGNLDVNSVGPPPTI